MWHQRNGGIMASKHHVACKRNSGEEKRGNGETAAAAHRIKDNRNGSGISAVMTTSA